MRRNVKMILMGGALAISLGGFAQNLPIIQTKYTADPIPMVYNDTVYLYTSHDEIMQQGS